MKPIRVALSGSGFKTPAHVGALLAVHDAGFEIVEIAGASGGSIVAALFACAMPLDQMKQMSLTQNWSDMLTFNLWSMLTKMGYCSGEKMLAWLVEHTADKTFADLTMDLTVVASDVSTELPYEFSREKTPAVKVATAVRASGAVPFVFAPVQQGAALLMDGGMCDNIPADYLVRDNVPRLGVQLVSKVNPLNPGSHSIFDIAPRVIDLMQRSGENTHVDLGQEEGAHYAFVETGYANTLDRNMAPDLRNRLMQDGYDVTKAALASIP